MSQTTSASHTGSADGGEPRPAPSHEEGPEERTGSGSLAALLGAVSALVVASLVLGFWKPLAVIASLFVMIMAHEAGHFFMARRAGMKCTEFFVGMGPRIWSVRRGEVEYGVKALPIGGYVKIIGMNNLDEVDPADEHRAYRQKGFWARIGVAVAGTATHLLIAFALLLVLNGVTGNPAHDELTPVVSAVSRVADGQSPAEQAGLRVGDEIVALDGTDVREWKQVMTYVGTRPGVPIRMGVERGGEVLQLTVTPMDAADFRPLGRDGRPVAPAAPIERGVSGKIGVGPTLDYQTVGPFEAVGRSLGDMWTTVGGTVKSLANLFTPTGVTSYGDQLAGKPVAPEAAAESPRFLSPVGLWGVADAQAEDGVASVLFLLVMINIFVGLFNMIPLLPFDGGHVTVAIYEQIRGRMQGGRRYIADVAKLLPVAYLTVAALIFIGVSSLYLDIRHPLDLN